MKMYKQQQVVDVHPSQIQTMENRGYRVYTAKPEPKPKSAPAKTASAKRQTPNATRGLDHGCT